MRPRYPVYLHLTIWIWEVALLQVPHNTHATFVRNWYCSTLWKSLPVDRNLHCTPFGTCLKHFRWAKPIQTVGGIQRHTLLIIQSGHTCLLTRWNNPPSPLPCPVFGFSWPTRVGLGEARGQWWRRRGEFPVVPAGALALLLASVPGSMNPDLCFLNRRLFKKRQTFQNQLYYFSGCVCLTLFIYLTDLCLPFYKKNVCWQ